MDVVHLVSTQKGRIASSIEEIYYEEIRFYYSNHDGNSGNKGTMEFFIPYKMYGVYDITDKKGRVFVFCLDGDTEKQISDDSFLAISNVVESDF